MQDKSPMLQHALHLFKYGNMSIINFSWLLIGHLTSCLEYSLHVARCFILSKYKALKQSLEPFAFEKETGSHARQLRAATSNFVGWLCWRPGQHS